MKWKHPCQTGPKSSAKAGAQDGLHPPGALALSDEPWADWLQPERVEARPQWLMRSCVCAARFKEARGEMQRQKGAAREGWVKNRAFRILTTGDIKFGIQNELLSNHNMGTDTLMDIGSVKRSERVIVNSLLSLLMSENTYLSKPQPSLYQTANTFTWLSQQTFSPVFLTSQLSVLLQKEK